MALARKLVSKIYEIKAHSGKVTCLDLGETGRVLVTGGQDRNVNLWAIGETKCFMSLTGHNGTIDCVKFAYNDDFVYSADDIGIIRRWDLNAQTMSTTLNGHMKSVRTLDFNPSGEYVVSGSNDTTVRLWDVRNQNKCIKNYRGHVGNVNSVKFSPDGLWIASAGSEGSIIIWDIRQSKQIIEFIDRTASVTCIQYHPYEFLLAAGRNDGSVFIYDLETNVLISKNDVLNTTSGSSVKCITFSENGECLFVGSPEYVSVIGWEPDREFDRIESVWNILDDMKIVNKKLICGSHENEFVSVYALATDRVFPFYNPSNNSVTTPFSHNQGSRKSFSRGNQKLRLSISQPVKLQQQQHSIEENDEIISNADNGLSSPNLSIEMIEDTTSKSDQHQSIQSNLSNESYMPALDNKLDSLSSSPSFVSTSPITNSLTVITQPSSSSSSLVLPHSVPTSSSPNQYFRLYSDLEGPSSLKSPNELDIGYNDFNQVASEIYTNDLSFGLNSSNIPISNYDEANLEDFPVNNATQPDYAPKMDSKPIKQKPNLTGTSGTMSSSSSLQYTTQSQKFKTPTTSGVSSRVISNASRKLTGVSSVSTMELHKIDDTLVVTNNKRQQHVSASKFKRPESLYSYNTNNKENNIKNRNNITVQIITKQPTRSKTSFDLRNQMNSVQSTKPVKITSYTTDDTNEFQVLASYHDHVYQELNNRHATLQMIQNSTRSHDVVGALKQAMKISGKSVFVDLLGAILEKSSTWNLDLCVLLLPEIYELLQSKHKFHYTRGCDALRVILSNFLPLIQENIDPWSPARCMGVDITRDERQNKCIECQQWLLRIRNLSDTQHIGATLTQLQNMIVDI